MHDTTLMSVAALLALVPAALLSWRRRPAAGPGQFAPRPDPVYWSVLVVALCGPMSWVAVQSGDAWATNFSAALWISIASSLVLFALLVAVTAQAWRLTPLLLPYLVVLGLMATIWQQAPGRPLTGTAPAIWLDLHILVSVLTYALLTLAAMAGLAVFLQERALKLKRPDRLSSLLPPIADSELLQVRLLIAGEIVLGVGLATGMALQYFGRGRLLIMDHKTLLSVVAFVLIAGLLAAHYRTGLRGRRAARLALCAYLLLTLAYPGVKFVTDVLVGR